MDGEGRGSQLIEGALPQLVEVAQRIAQTFAADAGSSEVED